MIGYRGATVCVPAGLADDEQDELAVLCAWRDHDVDDLDADVAGDLELLCCLRAEADAAEWVSV
jgi:hypothetical protein